MYKFVIAFRPFRPFKPLTTYKKRFSTENKGFPVKNQTRYIESYFLTTFCLTTSYSLLKDKNIVIAIGNGIVTPFVLPVLLPCFMLHNLYSLIMDDYDYNTDLEEED